MNQKTQKLFEGLFQEAHVVDIDFSKWDKWIRLVVVGGLHPENFNGRGPLHSVDFIGVEELSWKSHHLKVKLPPNKHCQWVIMDFRIKQDNDWYVISLLSVGLLPTPDLTIRCQDVKIAELSPDIVDEVNPDWNNPYRPLARLSIQEIFARYCQ